MRTLTTVRSDAFDQWCATIERALADPDNEQRWTEVLLLPAPPIEPELEPAGRSLRLARLTVLSDDVQLRRMTLLSALVSVTEERRALASRGRALARYLTAGGRATDADSAQA